MFSEICRQYETSDHTYTKHWNSSDLSQHVRPPLEHRYKKDNFKNNIVSVNEASADIF